MHRSLAPCRRCSVVRLHHLLHWVRFRSSGVKAQVSKFKVVWYRSSGVKVPACVEYCGVSLFDREQ